MLDNVEATMESGRTLGDLLTDALQTIVFGNGYLAAIVLAVFALVVVLSRVFKGGKL